MQMYGYRSNPSKHCVSTHTPFERRHRHVGVAGAEVPAGGDSGGGHVHHVAQHWLYDIRTKRENEPSHMHKNCESH
jgi:hypothetical protein